MEGPRGREAGLRGGGEERAKGGRGVGKTTHSYIAVGLSSRGLQWSTAGIWSPNP